MPSLQVGGFVQNNHGDLFLRQFVDQSIAHQQATKARKKTRNHRIKTLLVCIPTNRPSPFGARSGQQIAHPRFGIGSQRTGFKKSANQNRQPNQNEQYHHRPDQKRSGAFANR